MRNLRRSTRGSASTCARPSPPLCLTLRARRFRTRMARTFMRTQAPRPPGAPSTRWPSSTTAPSRRRTSRSRLPAAPPREATPNPGNSSSSSPGAHCLIDRNCHCIGLDVELCRRFLVHQGSLLLHHSHSNAQCHDAWCREQRDQRSASVASVSSTYDESRHMQGNAFHGRSVRHPPEPRGRVLPDRQAHRERPLEDAKARAACGLRALTLSAGDSPGSALSAGAWRRRSIGTRSEEAGGTTAHSKAHGPGRGSMAQFPTNNLTPRRAAVA